MMSSFDHDDNYSWLQLIVTHNLHAQSDAYTYNNIVIIHTLVALCVLSH